MGREAAGIYLREVRVLRKLSRVQLAAELGISDDQINRMEQGRNAMLGPTLLRLITRVDASYAEVAELLDAGDSPELKDVAVARARAWVTRAAAIGDRDLTPGEEAAELFELALRRTGGDRAAARRLLLRALDQALE
jgi:transcriptional regulator with XRE-family HTH domain